MVSCSVARTGIPPPPKKKNCSTCFQIPGTVADYMGATVILYPGFVEPSIMFYHQWKCKHASLLVMFHVMCINYMHTMLKDQQMHFGFKDIISLLVSATHVAIFRVVRTSLQI